MPITLNTGPNKNISGPYSECCSTTQLRYEFEDYGYSFDSVDIADDTVIMNGAEGDITCAFPAGRKIKLIETGTGSERNYTVQSVLWDSTNTIITIEEEILFSFGPGHCFPAWDRQVLYVIIQKSDLSTLQDNLFYFVDSNYKIIIDIGPIVQEWLKANNLLSIDYRIVYQEITDSCSFSSENSDFTVATNQQRQLLQKYGANLYDFIAKETPLGKHLSLFEEPVLWVGYFARFYVLVQDTESLLRLQYKHYDINKQQIVQSGFNADPSSARAINLKEFKISQFFDEEYTGYWWRYTSQPTDITEELLYRVKRPCNNPIMIEWLTSNGIYEKWLFQYEQAVIQEVEQGISYSTPSTDDIETVTTTKKRTAEQDTQFLTLKADQLTQNQVQGLHDIKRSTDVRVWLLSTAQDEDPPFVNVRVDSGYQTTFTTGKRGYEFSLNIEFPDNFDIFKT